MNFRHLFCNSLLAAGLITVSTGVACADRLVLTSQIGGQYDYGIQLDPNHGLAILLGDEITLTGLSGVTGASVLADLAFAYGTVIATPTSVTLVDTTPFVLDPIMVSQILSAVQVTSSVLTTGPVNYQVQTSGSTLSGTVPGPVAAVPEPGGLPMASAAIAAFLALKTKRRKGMCRRQPE